MPTQKPRTRLLWQGKKTVQEIVDRLHERQRILLVFPAGFHHAVSVHLAADDEGHGPVDVAFDDTALERIARIKGLREVSKLRQPLARAGMGVRVRTPPPQILFFPRDTGAWANARYQNHPAAAVV
jgi:hypothetical protein